MLPVTHYIMMTSRLKGTHFRHLLYDDSSNVTVYLSEGFRADDHCHVVHGKPVAVFRQLLHEQEQTL